MAHRAVTTLVLVLVLALAHSAAHPKKSKKDLLDRVWVAVERAMRFFTEDYSSINVDGLYGLRVGQGQIREAIKEHKEHVNPRKKDAILKRLQAMDASLTSAGDGAIPYVEARDPEYFSRFQQVIAKPYRLDYRPRRFSHLSQVSVGRDQDYDEDRGDVCYARLLGTFQEGGRTLPKCNMTNACLDLMTRRNTSGYFITHQLLYFIVLEHLGCEEDLKRFEGDVNMTEVESQMCASIYKEAESEVKEGDVASPNKDLFLEQSMLCGSLGHEDFLRPDWMHMVLSWQARDGCFKLPHQFSLRQELLQQDLVRQTLLRAMSRRGRSLLREKEMRDGCLAHMTGLGFGTLCLYLRVLLLHSLI